MKDHKELDQGIELGGFLLFLALVTIGLVLVIWPFVMPILWSALAAILFQPLYQRILGNLNGKANQAAIATLLIIFFAVLLPMIWIGSAIVRQAANVVIAFQEGRIDVATLVGQIFDALPSNLRNMLDAQGWGDFADLQARTQELLTQSAGLIAQQALVIGGGALGYVLAFGVGLYITYFLLRDGKGIGQAVMEGVPLQKDVAERLADKFLNIVRATIKGSVVVGIVQGALGALTFWIVGLPSVLLFGLVMAVFSLLPAIGPAIVWVPAAIWLFATGAIWQGIVVVVSGVAVIGMADNLLRPILVGRDTGIPDWIILVTTLGGIATMGLSGIVLGPMLAGLFLAGWTILREHNEAVDANAE
ncbi:AI-2E family transporter [Erythrobacter litoralis]|uniref:AI-2E family transporter n=1 Tax=Erythrobacter litoralis (strain HTCC2594) TaxID=314225 RepID=Q2N7A1_ERYLH|nr:AI-2E family transporter [Erythrobacter litoralis]ABC64440.1 hypothetical protein ELI_11740 [Erythrobacter litoralis HTCC2594]